MSDSYDDSTETTAEILADYLNLVHQVVSQHMTPEHTENMLRKIIGEYNEEE